MPIVRGAPYPCLSDDNGTRSALEAKGGGGGFVLGPSHTERLRYVFGASISNHSSAGIVNSWRRTQGRRTGRFLVLGSASMDLLRQSGESLAGRIS